MMENKTYTYIFHDILDNVLKLSENPSQFAEYLTQQIRELIGARTIVIAIKNEKVKSKILSVFPRRRSEWATQTKVLQLAEHSFNFDSIQFLNSKIDDKVAFMLLQDLEIEDVIVIPLIAAHRKVGAILLLDIMDLHGIDSVSELLTRLSGVFALIIRNSDLYQNMEQLVVHRTNELQRRNIELIERERQLEMANNEYELLNEKLIKTNTELIIAKDRAEESDRLKTTFLENLSHEIRTPMNSIMGFASLLPGELDYEQINLFSSIIYQNSEQLVHIIDDIVLYSRLQRKELILKDKPFVISDLFNEIFKSFNLPEYHKGVELIVDNSQVESLVICADHDKISQVFVNLISNAFKYTCNGNIQFGALNHNDQVVFYVKDTGMGIPKNEIDKVFDRFYRASNVNKASVGGTGLGLSIVKELIKLMNGKIWVVSEEGKGCQFFFTVEVKL